MFSIFLALSLYLPSDLGINLDSTVVQSDRSIQADEAFDNVVVLRGQLQFYGKAEQLVVMGGSVVLHEGSQVQNLVLFRGQVEQRDGALVQDIKGKGDYALFDIWAWARMQVEKFKNFLNSTFNWQWEWASGVLGSIFFIFISVLTFMIFLSIPGLGERSSLQIKASPMGCMGLGFMFLLAFIPISLLMLVTIVGILFIPFLAFFYVALYWLGFFVFARAFGELIFFPLRLGKNFVLLLVGFILLVFISQIPVIGFWMTSIASLVGCGALIRSLFMGNMRVQVIS